MSKLTTKQQAFVDEYLCDLNATQAAIRAGYSVNGARVRGHELLTNSNIAAAISEAQQARQERTQISADWVIAELQDTYHQCRSKGDMGNAVRSLELLGRHHGIFEKDNKQGRGDDIRYVVSAKAMSPEEWEESVRNSRIREH